MTPSTDTMSQASDTRTPSSDGEDGVSPTRAWRGWTMVLTLVCGLALGLLIAIGGTQFLGRDGDGAAAELGRSVTGEINSSDLLPDDLPVPPGAGATSAEEAVTAFLDAEVARDFETSFGYLDDVTRATYGSPAGWVSAHADLLPPIVEYSIEGQETAADGREILSTQVALVPSLDPVVGLTPAEAIVRWSVTEGEGGWGISLDSSPFEPQYPSDEGAAPAAREWAEDRQRCEQPANEHDGLVGSPALARQLCNAEATPTFDGPSPLDEMTGQPVFTAFGPEAFLAARVVRVSGPADLAAVLVPIGDTWTVIAILP